MPNALSNETSPYLLQHAENPVEWHPWGEHALTLARDLDKPILLSIGYSACHWCHVMAHESFEDPATAAVMNAHFINIKVDREERPDLDQIYQHAHAILSRRSGGWPLTLFLTPDQVPFYSGTYFPTSARYGLPGFTDLLHHIAGAWRERRAEIETQNASVLDVLEKSTHHGTPGRLDGAVITTAKADLAKLFDPVHGGFGGAPKFPNPADLTLLLREGENARHMALFTLSKMANGGIYDQIGGGFCRYSVDDHWEIPHFEKMLYDNGQLLGLYAEAWRLTRNPRYRHVITDTVAWLMREMHAPEGGFYSSLDADSEGEEGKFYVWQQNEIHRLLNEEEYALVRQRYGLNGAANFEHAWHLRVTGDQPYSDFIDAAARSKLLHARNQRIHPGRDDKILTSWNGLLITGLTRAGRFLGEPGYISATQQAVDFIHDRLWHNGQLLATSKGNKAHLNAYLDDHAFLLQGLLELLQADFRTSDLDFAITLADALLDRFEDRENGGFFFTSHDHEPLIQRLKPAHDNATPAGNGIAAYTLQRLGRLLGESRYLSAAERTLEAFAGSIQRNPAACPTLTIALEEYLTPPTTIILRGPPEEMASWRAQLEQRELASTLILSLGVHLSGLPPTLDHPLKNNVNAWICQGVVCSPAIDQMEVLLEKLPPLGKGLETRL